MERDRISSLITQLQAYQEAVNQADIEALMALFHEDASVDDEGVSFQVRPFHEYGIGTQEQIILSDFTLEGDRIMCLCHATNALSRALAYSGKPLKMHFMFRGERIARLEIPRSDVEEAKRLHQISDPFFTWVRENHPQQWVIMSTVTSDGGKTLAALAQAWQVSERSE